MEEQGVGCIVNVGASFQGAKDSVELSMRYPHVYAAVGVHPDHRRGDVKVHGGDECGQYPEAFYG